MGYAELFEEDPEGTRHNDRFCHARPRRCSLCGRPKKLPQIDGRRSPSSRRSFTMDDRSGTHFAWMPPFHVLKSCAKTASPSFHANQGRSTGRSTPGYLERKPTKCVRFLHDASRSHLAKIAKRDDFDERQTALMHRNPYWILLNGPVTHASAVASMQRDFLRHIPSMMLDVTAQTCLRSFSNRFRCPMHGTPRVETIDLRVLVPSL